MRVGRRLTCAGDGGPGPAGTGVLAVLRRVKHRVNCKGGAAGFQSGLTWGLPIPPLPGLSLPYEEGSPSTSPSTELAPPPSGPDSSRCSAPPGFLLLLTQGTLGHLSPRWWVLPEPHATFSNTPFSAKVLVLRETFLTCALCQCHCLK